jgi:sirohydrochlorin cobaltochelatase
MYQHSIPVWVSILMEEQQVVRSATHQSIEIRSREPISTTCLVMIAHGSRDPRWREPFERLHATIRRTTSKSVKLAYMEFISPTLIECARDAVAEGATQLEILPVFMAGGAHVSTDIPEQAQHIRDQFPELEVNILPPIGEDRRMFSLMCEIVREKIA